MRCSRSLLVAVIIPLASVAALAQGPAYGLGRTPTPEEIQAVNLSISPDGKGLPPGSGTAQEGAKIYAQKCAMCHGPTGAEGPSVPNPGSLWPYSAARPIPTAILGGKSGLGGAWISPYISTLWSYLNRAMPPKGEGSLSANEVYAVTAFLLYQKKLIREDEVMDANSLLKVPMPNRDCVPWKLSCTYQSRFVRK